MINAIINGIISLIMGLVSVITSPIDLLIKNALPDLSNALTSFGQMLDVIGDSIGWVISLSGISSSAISLIITYFTFKLTMPILFYSIKMAIKWYRNLKM